MIDTPMFMRIDQAFLQALTVRDFDRIEKLLHPQLRFRGLVPGAMREGTMAEEALSWLRVGKIFLPSRYGDLSCRGRTRYFEKWERIRDHSRSEVNQAISSPYFGMVSGKKRKPVTAWVESEGA